MPSLSRGLHVTSASRRNLSQTIADDLLDLIRQGEFRPGERLPTEKGLMELFGAGRNTVREAVQVLASQGILDVRPGRGTIVRSIASEHAIDPATFSALLEDRAIDDLHEFRRLLEVEAAGLAAKHSTNAQVQAIAGWLAALEHADGEGLPTWEQDIAFHRSILEASGNVIYLAAFDAVTDKLVATRKETQHVPRARQMARDEHRAILDAIQRQDVRAARRAMTRHIRSASWALHEARSRVKRT